MRLFDGVKDGDWALSAMGGWGIVVVDKEERFFPINIRGCGWYTMEGKFHTEDKAPTAWPEGKVPQYYLDIYGQPPKKMVKKKVKYFLNMYDDGGYGSDVYGYMDEERAKLLAGEQAVGVAVPLEYEYEVEE